MRLLTRFTWLLLLWPLCLFGQAGVQRQPLTTNLHFGPLPSEGHVPIWNAIANKWSNNIPSGGGNVVFSDLVWTNNVGAIYTVVDRPRIEFTTNRIFGRLIRADGTNTALGSNAAMPGLGGEKNTAVGTEALSVSGGTENTAMGHRAAISNSSGSFNVAIGSSAMEFSRFRSDNTAVGYNSMHTLSVGGQNTAIGSSTMDILTSSTDGTALGWGALDKLEGSGNTALGSQALLNAQGGGNYNVAIGYESMEASDRLEGNVAIGRGAFTGIDDLTNTVAIGYQATSLTGGLTNAVGIGALTRITANNQMMLGTNIINYVFRNVGYNFPSAQGAAATVLTNDGAGNLGWGTDQTSVGAAGLSTNANQFLGVPLAIIKAAKLTNTEFHGGITMTNSDAQTQVLRVDSTATTNALSVESNGIVSVKTPARAINIGESTIASFFGIGLDTAIGKPSIVDRGIFSDGSQVVVAYASPGFFGILDAGGYRLTVGKGVTAGFTGIGTASETPLALLSVGSGSLFQVDADGDVRTHRGIIITNIPGESDPFFRLAHTNGRGYTEFVTTNSVIATNRIVLSFGSNTVAAGQGFTVHSTIIDGGINTIVITNDVFQPASANLTNWSNIPTGSMANVVSTTFLTNWANAISNYVTAATNSASVTNWITTRQPASANLTNWSNIPTGTMANVVAVDYLTNWANAISNLANTKQFGTAVLTNLSGTGALTNTQSAAVSLGGTFTNGGAVNIAGGVTNWSTHESKGTLYASSNLLVKVGQSTSNAWVGGRIFIDASTQTTNHTGTANYTNLFTYTVPGNALTNTGDELEFYLSGQMRRITATTNGFKCIYGTETIFDTGFITASNCPWSVSIKITRTGLSAQRVEAKVLWNVNLAVGSGGNGTLSTFATNMPLAQVNGATNIFVLQGESRLPAAITNDYRAITWTPGLN